MDNIFVRPHYASLIMDDKTRQEIIDLFIQSHRAHLNLLVEHQALLRVIQKSMPYLPPEVGKEFKKYWEVKKKLLDERLLSTEKRNPSFSAFLDIDTPLFSSDEEVDGK